MIKFIHINNPAWVLKYIADISHVDDKQCQRMGLPYPYYAHNGYSRKSAASTPSHIFSDGIFDFNIIVRRTASAQAFPIILIPSLAK